jgi:cyclopropane fatty-acyl-phospholipid synthase-like methyltransferase
LLSLSDYFELNKDPILKILVDVLGNIHNVLEIGSGTGQHGVYFAENLPHLVWYTSDLPENLPEITERIAREGPENLRDPLALDVCDRPWPVSSMDAIFSANTLHIMPWKTVENFFEGIGEVLVKGGVLCVYGPFRYGGRYTSESNARFDQYLKQRDPLSGIKDFQDIDRLAKKQGLNLLKDYSMPANNQILVWTK